MAQLESFGVSVEKPAGDAQGPVTKGLGSGPVLELLQAVGERGGEGRAGEAKGKGRNPEGLRHKPSLGEAQAGGAEHSSAERWATRRRPLKPGQRVWLWEHFSWSQESPKQAGP